MNVPRPIVPDPAPDPNTYEYLPCAVSAQHWRKQSAAPTHWQRIRRLVEAVRPNKKRHRRSSTPRRSAIQDEGARAVEGIVGGFGVCGGALQESNHAPASGCIAYGRTVVPSYRD